MAIIGDIPYFQTKPHRFSRNHGQTRQAPFSMQRPFHPVAALWGPTEDISMVFTVWPGVLVLPANVKPGFINPWIDGDVLQIVIIWYLYIYIYKKLNYTYILYSQLVPRQFTTSVLDLFIQGWHYSISAYLWIFHDISGSFSDRFAGYHTICACQKIVAVR